MHINVNKLCNLYFLISRPVREKSDTGLGYSGGQPTFQALDIFFSMWRASLSYVSIEIIFSEPRLRLDATGMHLLIIRLTIVTLEIGSFMEGWEVKFGHRLGNMSES